MPVLFPLNSDLRSWPYLNEVSDTNTFKLLPTDSKQEDRARINALSPLSSPRGEGPSSAPPSPSSRMNPLLRDFESVSSSIGTSTKALDELNEHLAGFYMAALMKKTSLEKQAVALDSTHLRAKVEHNKLLAQRKRSIIAKLRGEQEQLRLQLSNLQRPKTAPGFFISHIDLNNWFTFALFILPLIAIFLAARIVLHPFY